MTQKELIEECLKMPDSYLDFPYGDLVAVIKNKAGKSFALVGVANEKDVVNFKKNCDPNVPVKDGDVNIGLKCIPDLALALREKYRAVIPGYYTNKTHWNTVILGYDVPIEEVIEMIALSYDLVTPKAKKKK